MERQERMQRVRVGLTGLAAVLIVAAAAAAVFESAGDESANAANAAAPPTAVENMLTDETETPNEPLAEIGAAPGSGPTEAEKDEAKAAAEGVAKPGTAP